MTRRSGLGRGLDALLPTGSSTLEERARAGEGSLRSVPVGVIDRNPDQPRERFEQESLEELAVSIATLGILQPLLVRAEPGDRYRLIAGERRWRAAQLAGLDEVPVLVVDTDDRGVLERALVENVHREDLNPVEEAAAYKQLIEDGGMTHDALAQRLGKNRVTVSNALRLLELPDGIKRSLIEGRITAAHGRVLLSLRGNPFQERLAQRVAHEGLSVRETEELARKYHDLTPSADRNSTRSPTPAAVSEAQRALADRLQTRVRVDFGKRKGRIVLDFVSLEELDRIVSSIVGERDST